MTSFVTASYFVFWFLLIKGKRFHGSTVGLVTDMTVVFGIFPSETVIFVLTRTLTLTTLTCLGQGASILQGLLHIMLFYVFSL